MPNPDDILAAAIGLPEMIISRQDYGQQVVFEMPSGQGCFVRYGQARAPLEAAPQIRRFLLAPKTGRLTRAEAMQFLGTADA